MADELRVSIEVADPPEISPMLAGLMDVVRPGEADRENKMVPEKLLMLVRVMVDVPDEPARIVRGEGFDVRVKSATLTVMTTECVRVPFVAVTVTA